MSTIQIEVTDRKGRHHSLKVVPSGTLMAALKSQGLPVAATCSGAKSCATCHVYAEEGYERVGAPDDDETDLLLESDHHRKGASRLSCQIELLPGLDGLHIEIAPQD
ncbi:2Fe-2S iron-sulfur cluster-binding protein [Burkholderia pseudomallei]|uniref:2Fe-2S iron-sulfur cluster-binding protein n=1 Tax=Burkholderia pseudomallei TaxID=28450 RepID=UPI0004F741FF|nr:2Fe-2S iron-sulfur cluster-binding protein [Burkholderia pseudomallei]AIP08998.1 ferredoxin [Burkholderia pseudomallei]